MTDRPSEPGPADSGTIQITASDGSPVDPSPGSSFQMEDGTLLVCMTQEAFNKIGEFE